MYVFAPQSAYIFNLSLGYRLFTQDIKLAKAILKEVLKHSEQLQSYILCFNNFPKGLENLAVNVSKIFV